MRALCCLAILGALPTALVGQDQPVAYLPTVLPPETARAVTLTMARLEAQGLPSQPMLDVVRLGEARRRAPSDILLAVLSLDASMREARQVLERAQRPVVASDVLSVVLSLRAGLDPEIVTAVARATPSSRALRVPLFVTMSLMDQGLPAHEALGMVRGRLAHHATDSEVLALPWMPGSAAPSSDRFAAIPPRGGWAHGFGLGTGVPDAKGGVGHRFKHPLPAVLAGR